MLNEGSDLRPSSVVFASLPAATRLQEEESSVPHHEGTTSPHDVTVVAHTVPAALWLFVFEQFPR